VLVQPQIESKRAPVSEYNYSFTWPVCTAQRGGGWQKRQLATEKIELLNPPSHVRGELAG